MGVGNYVTDFAQGNYASSPRYAWQLDLDLGGDDWRFIRSGVDGDMSDFRDVVVHKCETKEAWVGGGREVRMDDRGLLVTITNSGLFVEMWREDTLYRCRVVAESLASKEEVTKFLQRFGVGDIDPRGRLFEGSDTFIDSYRLSVTVSKDASLTREVEVGWTVPGALSMTTNRISC